MGVLEIYLHSLLTLALRSGDCSTLRPGKELPAPIEEVGEPQTVSARFEEQKHLWTQPELGTQFFECPAHSLVTISNTGLL
jgi:hypothetical protein